jgi:hypothetical protein
LKCPICGTKNENTAENCKMCKTLLTKKENGTIKVKSPKSRGKTITIVDIEDPLTRKKLEELTLIPGVNRKKALLLYESGIHSMEEFLQKAFHGEKLSENYSRTVANKLLVQSLKNKKKKQDIYCPSCKAPNPPDTERCNVCNFNIREEMESINMTNLSDKLSESVTELLSKLSESEDFKALPEDMKAQLATIVESDDVDIDMGKPKELNALGIDLDKIDDENKKAADESGNTKQTSDKDMAPESPPVEEKSEIRDADVEPEHIRKDAETPKQETPDFNTKLSQAISSESKPEPVPAPAAVTDAKESTIDAKKEKIRKILTEKMDKWRKSGYDVTGLQEYLEDVEGFKSKAKEILAAGKVIKNKYKIQLDTWREKGFDVSELEPLLDTDLDAFAEKAKDILKKQKKKK